MNEKNSWSDTLTEFLKSSNEDERVIALFQENILPQIAMMFKSKVLNWLEIGAGDGNKTQMIANCINSSKEYKKIRLTICEPSIDWLIGLQDSAFERLLPSNVDLDIFNKTAEQFMSSENHIYFDFVSMIQVMYSSDIKDALVKYINRKKKLTPCLIWVDAEDQSGDFYKMRKQLMDKGKVVVHSYMNELIKDLTSSEIRFMMFKTTNKVCFINKKEVLLKENHWLFPFILGYNIEDFNAMRRSDKTCVRTVVRNYITKLEKPELNIPDISILIFA